jgi:anti-sigma28 factor (negative regulator of flagellin synthesis)
MLLAFADNTVLAQEKKTEKNTAEATVEQKAEEPKLEISAYENRITVNNAPVDSTLEIYSIVGIKVKEIKIKSTSGEYPVDIAKGYYIIRIGETVQKVAIR